MKPKKRKSGSVNKRLWIIPVVILLVLSLSGGAYYAFNRYQERQAELKRIQEEDARQKAAEEAAYQAMKASVSREVFFDGVFINDLPVGGMTLDAVRKMLGEFEQKTRDSFKVQLSMGDKKFVLTPDQAGLAFDTEAVIKKAYETGRTSSAASERDQVQERFAAVEALKTRPLKLTVKPSVDAEKARAAVTEWAGGLSYEPIDAQVTGFDLASKTFKIAEAKSGLSVDAPAVADLVVNRLKAGEYSIDEKVQGKTVEPKVLAATVRSKLGHVSTATTLAGSSSGANRDHNISLIVKNLNGLVINPGETFSFNGTIGQRTAAKGYKEAGGILDGILVQEFGGGICQPNTTLYQAALKADLEIVSRSPHSWPSSYTKVGLDATVSWTAPDMKFKNNTEYPIAIVASFKKPDVVFHIYGRLLDPGVSISLIAEHNGYIKEAAPVMKVNYSLAPGQKVEIRAARTGQKATSYKIWYKDGVVIKKELVTTSTYRPIQGIYEYNPNPPPPPTPTPTTAPVPSDPTPPATPPAG